MKSASFVLTALLIVSLVRTGQCELFVGSGAKAGEIGETSAIVLVRLTATVGQNEEGVIPGHVGQARLRYDTDEKFSQVRTSNWQTVKAEEDHATHFHLNDLLPGRRWYYRIEFREDETGPSQTSDTFSFVTAPPRDVRALVRFHLTTCQDLRAESTYLPMIAQKPDFVISAGDNVYYDGQGRARTVPQAWQAYQRMFGLPAMKYYYRHVGAYFLKDDHDYRFNDADPTMKGLWVPVNQQNPDARYTETRGEQKLDVNWLTHEEGIRTFKQVFPIGEKTYRTVRWGKGVQLWFLENRDFRSANELPDGPEKTIWGVTQKSWLKETLLESDADYRIIVSPNPIIGPDRLMKGDNQANLNGFWHEGQAFLDWINDHKLTNVIVMCGDRHWQYHSIDHRNGRSVHEFNVGPTCDEHTQAIPPGFEGVERPYAARRGGFMSIAYQPDKSIRFVFHSTTGEPLYEQRFGGN